MKFLCYVSIFIIKNRVRSRWYGSYIYSRYRKGGAGVITSRRVKNSGTEGVIKTNTLPLHQAVNTLQSQVEQKHYGVANNRLLILVSASAKHVIWTEGRCMEKIGGESSSHSIVWHKRYMTLFRFLIHPTLPDELNTPWGVVKERFKATVNANKI